MIHAWKQRIITFCCQISWQCFSSLQDVFYAIRLQAQIYVSKCFKMSLFGFRTIKKTLSPLAYGCVDDALVDSYTGQPAAESERHLYPGGMEGWVGLSTTSVSNLLSSPGGARTRDLWVISLRSQLSTQLKFIDKR